MATYAESDMLMDVLAGLVGGICVFEVMDRCVGAKVSTANKILKHEKRRGGAWRGHELIRHSTTPA